jgi:hypothetical protein
MYLELGYTAVILSNMGAGTMTLIDYLTEHPLE